MCSGEKTAKRQQMTLHEFQGFISYVSLHPMVLTGLFIERSHIYQNQRNPFLKDAIVCPITKTHAQALVEKYEEKAVEGKLLAGVYAAHTSIEQPMHFE